MINVCICNLQDFFAMVNRCGAPVLVAAPGKEMQELRGNEFLQALLLHMHKDVTTLAIQPQSGADAMRVLRFMIEDRAGIEKAKMGC